MVKDRLAHLSHRMAVVTLWFVIFMLALNAANWFFPMLGMERGGYGLSFSLTNKFFSMGRFNIMALSWWKAAGAIVLTSIPLVALSVGLLNLRSLFKEYAQGLYFSSTSSVYLERVGRSVLLWVLLSFLAEPLLGLWLSLGAPVGQRFFSLSIQSSELVSIFVAICIMLIARILRRAAAVDQENKLFV